MLAIVGKTSNPNPWPWQSALFPGLDPWPVLWAGDPDVNPEGIDYGYKALALSIFYQAVRDAQGWGDGAEDARAWLDREGLEFLTLAGVGVQPGKYRAWIAKGCPKGRVRASKMN